MKYHSPQLKPPTDEVVTESSTRFLTGVFTTFAVGLAGRFALDPYAAEHGWRRIHNVLNCSSYLASMCDSVFLVGSVSIAANLVINKMDILRKVPQKTAVLIGSVALGSGLAMNTISETPVLANATGIDEIFYYHPHIADGVWGDATSLIDAAALTLLMREKEGELPKPPI